MANRRSLMGDMRNAWWQNVFGIIGLVAVLALSVRLIFSLIGGRSGLRIPAAHGRVAPMATRP
ncbi:hypothetical protein [Microbacterium lacus]|uniref:Uncharacterized protein n=1 Tax=Microbacterium lacus TaxID=415217 RepID=A0ABP4T845_9MICO